MKMEDNISFSILLASYNLADYIKEAIQSILSQTYPYWELIIVDDASIDNSVEIIKPFLKDKRIKLIIHEKNKGVGQTTKTAASNASNMILGIIDSDDKLSSKALEIMAKAYKENPEYGVIYSTHWICNHNLRKIKIAEWVGEIDPKSTNLKEFKVSHFKTFRKDIYKKTNGINPKLKMCYDADIIYKLEEITKLKFINKPLYYYRLHKGGVSSKNKFGQNLDNYIAEMNAYHRRKTTKIPNISMNDLYFKYYKLMFNDMIQFFQLYKEYFKIDQLFEKLFKKFSNLPLKVRIKLKRFKLKYFYWF